jgi:hypothetical protein
VLFVWRRATESWTPEEGPSSGGASAGGAAAGGSVGGRGAGRGWVEGWTKALLSNKHMVVTMASLGEPSTVILR